MSDKTISPEVMTTAEAAAYLRVHPRTLTRLAQLGQLPCFRMASHWRFLKSELDAWMQAEVRSRQLNPVRDN